MKEVDGNKEKIYAIRYQVQSLSGYRCSIFMTERARDKYIKDIQTYYAGVTFAETFEFVRDNNSFKTVKG